MTFACTLRLRNSDADKAYVSYSRNELRLFNATSESDVSATVEISAVLTFYKYCFSKLKFAHFPTEIKIYSRLRLCRLLNLDPFF